MKKFISVLLILLVTLVSFSSFSDSARPADTNVSIVVNGNIVNLERLPASINGRVLVPARTVFEQLGAKVDVYDGNNKVDISFNNSLISMSAGDMYANVNKQKVEMDTAPVVLNDTLLIPVRFTAEHTGTNVEWDGNSHAVLLGRSKSTAGLKSGKFLVVIDAGHGGKDSGAQYGGVKEKDLNLDIAKRLNGLLQKEGITTRMTRNDDTFIDLYERAGIANRLGADLFVSVHNNAGYTRYNGSMTLYYPSDSGTAGGLTGKDLAGIVQKELNSQLDTKNLGIIERPNLVVLRETKMPSIIAEVGYMTNNAELERLNTAAFRQKTAQALADAVIKALKIKE